MTEELIIRDQQLTHLMEDMMEQVDKLDKSLRQELVYSSIGSPYVVAITLRLSKLLCHLNVFIRPMCARMSVFVIGNR